MRLSCEVWQDKSNSIGIILGFIYLIQKTHVGQHASLFLSWIFFFSFVLFATFLI